MTIFLLQREYTSNVKDVIYVFLIFSRGILHLTIQRGGFIESIIRHYDFYGFTASHCWRNPALE